MAEINLILNFLIHFFSNYSQIISFFGVLFGGEPVFVALAILYNKNLNLIFILLFFGILGSIVYDLFWFFISRSSIRKFILPNFIFNFISRKNTTFKKFEKKDLFVILFSTKFLLGTRIATLISVSLNKISLKKFFVSSLISSILAGFIFVFVGFLAGRGFELLLTIFNNTIKAVSVFSILIILYVFLRSYFHLHIINYIKKIFNFFRRK